MTILNYANTVLASQAADKQVTLWGEGTPGGKTAAKPEDIVRAAKVAISPKSGAMAWAVMDEGVKARINTPNGAAVSSDAAKAAQLGTGIRPNAGSIHTLGDLKRSLFEPVATAIIPASVRAALLIFIGGGNPQSPGNPAQAKPKVLVIEDSPKNFPDGGAFIANFHQSHIRFVVGEHKGLLKPGGSHGYALPKQRDSFNMAPVIFEFLKQDSWRVANESSLRFVPGVRYLVFAYVDPQSGRPRIKTYQDHVR